jgi:hypothetical protein
MTIFPYFIAAILIFYMATFLFDIRTSACFGRANFPLYAAQSLDIGGKFMKSIPVHIIMHKIAFLFSPQKSSIP